jgi:hypothetical protein
VKWQRLRRLLLAVTAAALLAGCMASSLRDDRPVVLTPRLRGPLGLVVDSVLLPTARREVPGDVYGLYTVLLARTADKRSQRVLAELLSSTVPAAEAALPAAQLNVITVPVKDGEAARRLTLNARAKPDERAQELLVAHYDFGQAALLATRLCRPDSGTAVMKACGSALPDGPLLVTSARPLGPNGWADQRLLVVNLGTTAPEAVPEVLAAYRRQVQQRDFAQRSELDSFRLSALNALLDAARLLPGLSKALTGG